MKARADKVGRPVLWVTVLTALTALVRFATLDLQSFDPDEGVTVLLLRLDLGGMLSTIPDTESTPPVYYTLAWLWTQVVGTGEVGVRSLSALAGTATVLVAYLAARELVAERAALIAAALVATSPFLIWYSQEARAYSLLVLVAAVAFLFFGRALRRPGATAPLVGWAILSALALATHYFAVLVVAPQAVWLLLRVRRRNTLVAVGAVALAGAALLPLALDQGGTGNFKSYVEGTELSSRLKEVPKKFLVGEQATPGDYGAFAEGAKFAMGLLIAAGLWLALTRVRGDERLGALIAGSVAAAAVVLPVLAALGGLDYLASYTMIAAYPPLAVAVGAGLGGGGRIGIAAAAALCGLGLATAVAFMADPDLRRYDFRAAAQAIGDSRETRVIVATPDGSPAPLAAYGVKTQPPPPSGEPVRAVVLLGMSSKDGSTRMRAGPPPVPPPGFLEVAREERDRFVLVRLRSPRPVRVTPDALAASRLGEAAPAVLIERP